MFNGFQRQFYKLFKHPICIGNPDYPEEIWIGTASDFAHILPTFKFIRLLLTDGGWRCLILNMLINVDHEDGSLRGYYNPFIWIEFVSRMYLRGNTYCKHLYIAINFPTGKFTITLPLSIESVCTMGLIGYDWHPWMA